MKVTLPAIFTKITSRADRSYKIEFETRELAGGDATKLMEQIHQEGWLLFSPNEIQELDLPKEKADSMVGEKTPSQRLRGIIFVTWQNNGSKGSFEDFYHRAMERIIDKFKERL